MAERTDRRRFLNRSLQSVAGVSAACSLGERVLLAAPEDEATQSERPKPGIAPGPLPCGKIGNVSISRLFMGGNMIGAYAHSRDLMYVPELFRAYNTESKIFETLELAEQCGINTVMLDPRDWPTVLKYKRERGGQIQTLIGARWLGDMTKTGDQIKRLVDEGATILYLLGVHADRRLLAGDPDTIGRVVDLIKQQGVPAGVGSHSLQTPITCERDKVNADFYVKSFHMDRYWSASPQDKREEWCWYKGRRTEHGYYHDNIWCLDAEKTAAFMESVDKPWVAFKVMAAGAIHPKTAFSHAYRNGADFIVAGMFDFQVEQDVQIAWETLAKISNRKRPWRA